MNRRSFLLAGAAALAWATAAKRGHSQLFHGPVSEGPFQPDWESLQSYKCPEWYRDAKLGIWAHWSPQCVPEQGDWYARNMYIQGMSQYQSHLRDLRTSVEVWIQGYLQPLEGREVGSGESHQAL